MVDKIKTLFTDDVIVKSYSTGKNNCAFSYL